MTSIVSKIYTNKGRNVAFKDGEIVINLGCGAQKYEGVLGMDVLPKENVDIVHNLNETPWPIETSSVDVILGFHVFEHLADLNKIMEEVYRVLKPGGRLVIEVPYFRHVGAFQDPTHCHFFTSQTMAYFYETPKRKFGLYANVHFRNVGVWIGWPTKSKNPIVNFFKHIINVNKNYYDEYISRLFPAKVIVYELEAVK